MTGVISLIMGCVWLAGLVVAVVGCVELLDMLARMSRKGKP